MSRKIVSFSFWISWREGSFTTRQAPESVSLSQRSGRNGMIKTSCESAHRCRQILPSDGSSTQGYQGKAVNTKPQNILLSTNGPDALLKLSDFGISKILTDMELNTACGTPIYMAPQIWMMQPYDEKVDIWSIGVATYYMLSGEYPFYGENTQQLLQKICKEQLKFSPNIWDYISSRAQILLRTMLNKDRRRRPSAEQVQNHIWFSQQIPKNILEDPNLAQAIMSICRQKVKTKKIKKEREMKEIVSPSRKVSKVRAKFLLMREEQLETYCTSISSMIEQN